MAFFGVGYISAIGHAMNLAGLYISKQDGDGEVDINLWFAGGFLSCLFWVSIIHVQGKILCLSVLYTTCLSRAYCPHTQLSCLFVCLPGAGLLFVIQSVSPYVHSAHITAVLLQNLYWTVCQPQLCIHTGDGTSNLALVSPYVYQEYNKCKQPGCSEAHRFGRTYCITVMHKPLLSVLLSISCILASCFLLYRYCPASPWLEYLVKWDKRYHCYKKWLHYDLHFRSYCHSLLSLLWAGWCSWLDLSSCSRSKRRLGEREKTLIIIILGTHAPLACMNSFSMHSKEGITLIAIEWLSSWLSVTLLMAMNY